MISEKAEGYKKVSSSSNKLASGKSGFRLRTSNPSVEHTVFMCQETEGERENLQFIKR